MRIGVPKEIKPQENRIGLTPDSVKILVTEGHEVLVENIRGYGMMGGIDMKLNTKPGKAGYETFKYCYEAGVNFKATGDCLIIAPQFICEKKHIDEIIDKLRTGITNYQKNQKN